MAARSKDLPITRTSVREWLESQDTYTLFKPIVKRHKTRQTYVNELGQQLQRTW